MNSWTVKKRTPRGVWEESGQLTDWRTDGWKARLSLFSRASSIDFPLSFSELECTPVYSEQKREKEHFSRQEERERAPHPFRLSLSSLLSCLGERQLLYTFSTLYNGRAVRFFNRGKAIHTQLDHRDSRGEREDYYVYSSLMCVSFNFMLCSWCVLGGRGGNKNNRVTICGFNEYTVFCVSANCETNPSLQFAYFRFPCVCLQCFSLQKGKVAFAKSTNHLTLTDFFLLITTFWLWGWLSHFKGSRSSRNRREQNGLCFCFSSWCQWWWHSSLSIAISPS